MKLYLIGNSDKVKTKTWAAQLRSKGFQVLTTADIQENLSDKDSKQIALTMLSLCDNVVVLPDYDQRSGAIEERTMAFTSFKPVFDIKKSNKITFGQYLISAPYGDEYYCENLNGLAQIINGETA